MKLYFLKPTEWEWVFKDFSDLASDKHYKKIKYSEWRELHKLWQNAYAVVVERNLSTTIRVRVFCSDNVVHLYCYNHNDESLGAFLYENYIVKGKWKRMSTGYPGISDEEIVKEIKRQLSESVDCATSACTAATAISAADIKKAKQWLDNTALESKANSTAYWYDRDGEVHYDTKSTVDTTASWAEYAKVSDYNNANSIADLVIKPASYDGTYGICDKIDTKADIADVNDKIKKAITEHENADKIFMNKKENDIMKGFNFDFGPCTGDNVRLSMYGLAVKNAAGTYVSYNPKSKEIVDVDILNFDGGKYMYKFPVALSQVAVGDVVIHNRKPMFVVALDEIGKNLTVVDVCAGEQKTVIPTVNMFGFNFITKIVSLFDMTGGVATASEAQPFGNMLPLMLMSGDNKDIDPMMLMMLMGGGDMSALTANPMMLYLMMKDGKGKDVDPLMLMLMMNQHHTCKCGCHDAKNDEAATV